MKSVLVEPQGDGQGIQIALELAVQAAHLIYGQGEPLPQSIGRGTQMRRPNHRAVNRAVNEVKKALKEATMSANRGDGGQVAFLGKIELPETLESLAEFNSFTTYRKNMLGSGRKITAVGRTLDENLTPRDKIAQPLPMANPLPPWTRGPQNITVRASGCSMTDPLGLLSAAATSGFADFSRIDVCKNLAALMPTEGKEILIDGILAEDPAMDKTRFGEHEGRLSWLDVINRHWHEGVKVRILETLAKWKPSQTLDDTTLKELVSSDGVFDENAILVQQYYRKTRLKGPVLAELQEASALWVEYRRLIRNWTNHPEGGIFGSPVPFEAAIKEMKARIEKDCKFSYADNDWIKLQLTTLAQFYFEQSFRSYVFKFDHVLKDLVIQENDAFFKCDHLLKDLVIQERMELALARGLLAHLYGAGLMKTAVKLISRALRVNLLVDCGQGRYIQTTPNQQHWPFAWVLADFAEGAFFKAVKMEVPKAPGQAFSMAELFRQCNVKPRFHSVTSKLKGVFTGRISGVTWGLDLTI